MTDKKINFDPNQLTDQMKESAQQIWLAGLGAFAKNQEEGKKIFEKLVEDGLSLQKKTQSTLNAKVHEATDKISEMASSLSKQAPNTWAPLEDIFQNRVAKANEKLGVPSQEAFEALQERVAHLESLLLQSGAAGGKPSVKTQTQSTGTKRSTPSRKAPQAPKVLKASA
jgi:poly(hydroxyalkanoate) granule-associated protein